MNELSHLADYREDFYYSLYRCWLITEKLGFNRNMKKVLTLDKAAFADFLITNPNTLNICLSFFGIKQLKIKSSLYCDNLEFGRATQKNSFFQCSLFLQDIGAINISPDGPETYISIANDWNGFPLIDAPELTETINSLKPVIGKSLATLHSSIMR